MLATFAELEALAGTVASPVRVHLHRVGVAVRSGNLDGPDSVPTTERAIVAFRTTRTVMVGRGPTCGAILVPILIIAASIFPPSVGTIATSIISTHENSRMLRGFFLLTLQLYHGYDLFARNCINY